MRSRIRPKGEMPRLRCVSQVVEHAAGLHARRLAVPVDPLDTVHVLGHVDHDSGVARLAGEACSAAARDNRRAILARDSDRGDHIIGVLRQDDADGDLPVVRGVRCVQRAIPIGEPDLAAHGLPERRRQGIPIQVGALDGVGARSRRRDARGHVRRTRLLGGLQNLDHPSSDRVTRGVRVLEF